MCAYVSYEVKHKELNFLKRNAKAGMIAQWIRHLLTVLDWIPSIP